MIPRIARVTHRLGSAWRSFSTKFALLVGIFLAVPAILFAEFRAVDQDRNDFLLCSIQGEGRLVAQGLLPYLESFRGRSADALTQALGRLGGARVNVKLLFRPEGARDPAGFFYVASVPSVATEHIEMERDDLIQSGLFDKLRDTCDGGLPLAQRYTNPAGREEVLTSITPTMIRAGCWVVITSHVSPEVLRSSLGRPYWQTPEIQMAATIYLLMAVIVGTMFVGMWRNLRRFEGLARDIRTAGMGGRSFAALNRVPELEDVAKEFDHLVQTLHTSALRIRETAEDNAHALKAPLAVISQCVEPLKSGIPGDDTRRQRALDLIERSVVKLDALVSAARSMDEAAADAVALPQFPVNLSTLLDRMLAGYSQSLLDVPVRLTFQIQPGLVVLANDDLVETVLDNLLSNAVSFSPEGGQILVTARRVGGAVELAVEDQGPGVEPANLERIFDRYFSYRPQPPPGGAELMARRQGPANFGIGLWIVRRSVESAGAAVRAENRPIGGLRVVVRFPSSN